MSSRIPRSSPGRAAVLTALLLVAGCGKSGASVTGRVVLTGVSGAVHAQVTLQGPQGATVATAADGSWRVDDLAPGHYLLVVEAKATREGREARAVDVPTAGTVVAPTLTFEATGAISGTVTGVGGTAAPVGTVVAVVGTGAVARPDADGHFELEGVPAGSQLLVATAPDGARALDRAVAVAQGVVADAPPLVLASPGAAVDQLSGRVTVLGETDVSGIAVTLVGPVTAAAVTAADGSYTFTAIPPGHYVVTATAASTLEGTRSASVDVTGPGAGAPGLQFIPTGSVRGRVTLGGATTGNAGIAVLVDDWRASPLLQSAVGFTDDKGDYEVDGAPVGTAGLLALRAGYGQSGTASFQVAWRKTVDVPDVTLTPNAGGTAAVGDLQGQVTLVGAADDSGIEVSLTGATLLPTASTSADGTFDLPGVPVGFYTAHFTAGPYATRVNDVLILPGEPARFLIGGNLEPLPPIEMQRGVQRFSGGPVTRMLLPPSGLPGLLAFEPAQPGAHTGSLTVDTGSSVAKLDDHVYDQGFQYAGSDDVVVYVKDLTSTVPAIGTLEEVDTFTGARTTLSTHAAVGSLRVLVGRTREWIAFVEPGTNPTSGDLMVAPVGDGPATRLAQDALAERPVITLGDAVVYASQQPGTSPPTLESVPVTGGAPTQLAGDVDGQVLFLSADHQTVYFADSLHGLDAVPAAGGAVRSLATGILFDAGCRRSGDRKAYLCFGGADAGSQGTPLERIDLASGDVTVLDPKAQAGPIGLSADGRYAACATGTVQAPDLDLVPLAGGPVRTVATAVPQGRYAFSADGNTLVVADHATGSPATADIEVVDTGTGAATTLATGAATVAPAFSKDGTQVVFLGDYDATTGVGTVEAVPRAGGPPVALVSHATDLWRIADEVLACHGGEPAALSSYDGVYLLPDGAP